LLIRVRAFLLLLFLPPLCWAQHDWQKPKALKTQAELAAIIGPVAGTDTPSKPLKILWVWGYDRPHKPGAHDYLRVRDLMTGLLGMVPKVSVEPVYLFPTAEQFASADLACFFLHLPQLSAEQYESFKDYIAGGGGVVALHETAIMRPPEEGKKLVECLGMSWDEGRSKWGAIFEDISIKNEHEIFRGLPSTLRIADEFYWQLNQLEAIEILGKVRTGPDRRSKGPVAESALSRFASPVFWTMEMGKGRVFGTTTGHNTFSYYDPELRIVLFRAMAWAMRESAAPFMPLVSDGITNAEGLVGTTDTMRNWPGKRRGPPTILAFGDSITQRGYRHALFPKLKATGAPFTFIGPLSDATSRHAGYGGRNTAHLRSIAQRIYQQHPADIVLLHSGHNSFAKDKPVAGIVRDTEAIIALIRDINPKAVILLAQVIHAGKLPKYSYIPALNLALAESAKSLEGVVLVDQAAGFDWRTDTEPDKVHPNATGAEKIAATWLGALLPILRSQ
jgi:type 1 glutamine amidotransferase/lysophospholipase L1-like esterase